MKDRMAEGKKNTGGRQKRNINSDAPENRKGEEIFQIIALLLDFAILLPSLQSVRR